MKEVKVDGRTVNTITQKISLMEIRDKVNDYLSYSIIQGDRINATSIGSCQQTCGVGSFKQECCAGIQSYNWNKSRKDFFYACVDKAIAPGADMTMNIADFNVSITCVDSGSKYLSVAFAAVLTFLSLA